MVKENAHFRTQFSGNNEWYTPSEWIEIARRTMGAIDLDPATSLIAQETVKANAYITAQIDSLSQGWYGRIWLNPPYSRSLMGRFIDKLLAEYECGRVREAILLTHNYSDTAWFHKAASGCTALCFPRGRIRFVSMDKEFSSPTQGQTFFYFGSDPSAFKRNFEEYGLVVGRL